MAKAVYDDANMYLLFMKENIYAPFPPGSRQLNEMYNSAKCNRLTMAYNPPHRIIKS